MSSAGSVSQRVTSNRGLRNQLAQMGAKATLESLARDPSTAQWTFDVRSVTRQIAALSLDLAYLDGTLEEDAGPQAYFAATAWERIANITAGKASRSAWLNAALHYDLAGYQANAICLARRVQSDAGDSDSGIDELVATFLQRKYMRLINHAESFLREPAVRLLEELDEVQTLSRLSDGTLAKGLSRAAHFFLSGDYAALDEAVSILETASRSYGLLGEASHHTTSRSLAQLLQLMARRSIWAHLGNVDNARWRRYLRILARGLGSDLLDTTSISELWPSQVEALEGGLLRRDRSLALRMPTSAGKTRIAEMAMVHQLSTSPGTRCIYIAPYRALVTEIEEGLTNLFSDVGFSASNIAGAYEMDDLGDSMSRGDELLVLTPEKLDLLLRLQPQHLENVRLIVIDEGHVVGDRSRGAKFELLLSRLRKKLPDARFLFMSAVVPDKTLEQFARWLADDASAVLDSDWRPSVQRYAKLEWSGNRGTLRYSQADVETGGLEFVPNVVIQRQFQYMHPETRRRRSPRFPQSKGQVAAELAFLFGREGPVLVFCALPDWSQAVARELLDRLVLAEAVDEPVPRCFSQRDNRSVSVARDWLGGDHPVVEMLQRGIAYHHGRLPAAVREAIELDIRDGALSVLAATNTLGQGVNLPIRTVVIHSTRRWDEDLGRADPISARELWNIAGRAGRAGHETQGLIVHIVASTADEEDFASYEAARDDVEPVYSALLQLLVDLVQDRISDDEAALRLDSDLLALLVEEDVDVDVVVADTIANSLFAVQAADMNAPSERVVNLAQWASRRIVGAVPSTELRALYATTGLSSASCELLREHAAQSVDTLSRLFAVGGIGDRDELVGLSLSAARPVREMLTNAPDIGSVEEAISMWLDGEPVSHMATAIDVAPLDLTRFIEDVFVYRLPWVVSGYFQIASHVLQVGIDSTLASNLAGMIRHGVPTPAAAWALTSGISPRQAAIRVSQGFLAEHPQPTAGQFREWLAGLDVESLADSFDVQGHALEATARAVFRSSRNQLLERLDGERSLLPMHALVRPVRRAIETGAIWRLESGTSLEVVRDFDSMINRNAVYLVHDGVLLGYLTWGAAQALGPEIDAGVAVSATLVEIQESDGVALVVRLEERS